MRWFWGATLALSVAMPIGIRVGSRCFSPWGDLVVAGATTLLLAVLGFLWLPRIASRAIAWGLGVGGPWVGLLIKHLYHVRH